MAISDTKSFTSYINQAFTGAVDNSSDVFKWVIVTNTFTATDEDAVGSKLADFTVVGSTGNYVANTTIANTSWTKSGAVYTLDGDDWSFTADVGNPTTGKSILLYNDSSVDKSAVAIVDLTVDGGVTPANTTQGLTYTINAEGIYKVTRTV